MSFSCSKCNFTANFESALTMHRQLHHGEAAPLPGSEQLHIKPVPIIPLKLPPPDKSPFGTRKYNLMTLGSRTSATRIFGKLRAKICRSKTMFAHPEDPLDNMLNSDFSCRSDCTSKAMQLESPSRLSAISNAISNGKEPQRETYACHLCSFEADRITVLDRHLLNDHKIGMDNLLKLVLAKTKDGLVEDSPPDTSSRQSYYKPVTGVNGDFFGNGEFVIPTAAPNMRLFKHAAINTDLTWLDIPEILSEQLDSITKETARPEKNELLEKMQTLNSYMCKFVDSSNTLKRALCRTPGPQYSARRDDDELMFDLKLGSHDTPRSTRDWKRAYSEKLERYKSKRTIHGLDKFRSDKSKLSSESYYF
ncbi:hypothetical protein O0L34_g13463 [Tuta absoluta]|nr:hypothetical protein O0L34_g13463 [Tuta absoluta]